MINWWADALAINHLGRRLLSHLWRQTWLYLSANIILFRKKNLEPLRWFLYNYASRASTEPFDFFHIFQPSKPSSERRLLPSEEIERTFAELWNELNQFSFDGGSGFQKCSTPTTSKFPIAPMTASSHPVERVGRSVEVSTPSGTLLLSSFDNYEDDSLRRALTIQTKAKLLGKITVIVLLALWLTAKRSWLRLLCQNSALYPPFILVFLQCSLNLANFSGFTIEKTEFDRQSRVTHSPFWIGLWFQRTLFVNTVGHT